MGVISSSRMSGAAAGPLSANLITLVGASSSSPTSRLAGHCGRRALVVPLDPLVPGLATI